MKVVSLWAVEEKVTYTGKLDALSQHRIIKVSNVLFGGLDDIVNIVFRIAELKNRRPSSICKLLSFVTQSNFYLIYHIQSRRSEKITKRSTRERGI